MTIRFEGIMIKKGVIETNYKLHDRFPKGSKDKRPTEKRVKVPQTSKSNNTGKNKQRLGDASEVGNQSRVNDSSFAILETDSVSGLLLDEDSEKELCPMGGKLVESHENVTGKTFGESPIQIDGQLRRDKVTLSLIQDFRNRLINKIFMKLKHFDCHQQGVPLNEVRTIQGYQSEGCTLLVPTENPKLKSPEIVLIMSDESLENDQSEKSAQVQICHHSRVEDLYIKNQELDYPAVLSNLKELGGKLRQLSLNNTKYSNSKNCLQLCENEFFKPNINPEEQSLPGEDLTADIKAQFPRTQSEIKPRAESPEKMELFYIDRQNNRQKKLVTNPDLKKRTIKVEDIPNKFSLEDKRDFFEKHRESEKLDYVANYEAIQMQHKNESDFGKKVHITKSKGRHGQISLKRSFGVSYVKALGCHQKGVSDIYRPLPRLVIQDSKNCQLLESLVGHFARSIHEDFFEQRSGPLLGFMMKSSQESHFRGYLGSKQEAASEANLKRHFCFKTLEEIKHFFEHEIFLSFYLDCNFLEVDRSVRELDHLKYGISPQQIGSLSGRRFMKSESKEALKRVKEIISDNKLKLTIFGKKSLNSKKCFLKPLPFEISSEVKEIFFRKKKRKRVSVANLEEEKKDIPVKIDFSLPEILSRQLQNKIWSKQYVKTNLVEKYIKGITNLEYGNFNTLSFKMEAFVDETFWKGLDKNEKDIIFTYVYVFKLKIEEFLFYKGVERWTFKDSQKRLFAEIKLAKDSSQESDRINSEAETDKEGQSSDKRAMKGLEMTGKNKTVRREMRNRKKKKKKYSLEDLKQQLETLEENYINDYDKALDMLERFPQIEKDLFDCLLEKKVHSLRPVLPHYLVNTRDCFMFDLDVKEEILKIRGRDVTKRTFFFRENDSPSNFNHFSHNWPKRGVGLVAYDNYFSEEELRNIEDCSDSLEDKFYQGAFLANTGQPSLGAKNIKRTKFFFGARYIWHAQQLTDPYSNVAGGVRVDTSQVPLWVKNNVQSPMEQGKIVDTDFFNSIALNIYHDGEEGLAQHFDDAVRFKQPIYSLRIFSDARLSFGSQLYSFCNGAFCVDLPRGCILVMLENGYAANGLKHCVRPVDMTGKSAAFILRQMHHAAVKVAQKYDWFVDFPLAFQTLSLDENSVEFWRQQTILEKRPRLDKSSPQKRGPKCKKVKTGNEGMASSVLKSKRAKKSSEKRSKVTKKRKKINVSELLIEKKEDLVETRENKSEMLLEFGSLQTEKDTHRKTRIPLIQEAVTGYPHVKTNEVVSREMVDNFDLRKERLIEDGMKRDQYIDYLRQLEIQELELKQRYLEKQDRLGLIEQRKRERTLQLLKQYYPSRMTKD